MPALLMRTPVGSILEQTCRLVVQRQIAYGEERGVPWGVSESGYNARDLEMTYKYSAFGVPGLGLKRGLGDAIVITPHATGLAAMIDPAAAVRNFAELRRAGALGAYGFFEAIDYTASRRPPAPTEGGPATWRITREDAGGATNVCTTDWCGPLHAERWFRPPIALRTPPRMCLAGRGWRFNAVGTSGILPMVSELRHPWPRAPRTHLLSNGGMR